MRFLLILFIIIASGVVAYGQTAMVPEGLVHNAFAGRSGSLVVIDSSSGATSTFGPQIESLPYEQVLTRFDRPNTFFYLDPPYWGCEDDYGKGIFEREDFGKMRDLLKGLNGKFILSINDVPQIRELFSKFKIDVVPTTYSVSKNKKIRVQELLISNY